MLFFPFFWIYNILKGGNIIKEEYYKDITIHEFCYLFIKKKKNKRSDSYRWKKRNQRKRNGRGKVLPLQEAWISFQKSLQSRKLAAKSCYDRVVGAHDLFSSPPAITFRIRPPCIKYDVVVQFKQAWRGIRRRIGITVTSQPFTVSRLLES